MIVNGGSGCHPKEKVCSLEGTSSLRTVDGIGEDFGTRFRETDLVLRGYPTEVKKTVRLQLHYLPLSPSSLPSSLSSSLRNLIEQPMAFVVSVSMGSSSSIASTALRRY